MKPTLILKAAELRKHAKRIADSIARHHASGCCVVRRPVSNPTLVAHGLVKASLWHILTHEPPRRAVADLYVGSKAEAARITRLLANILSSHGHAVTLDLLDNQATPADLKAHPRSTVASTTEYAMNARRRGAPKHYLEQRRLERLAKRVAKIREERKSLEQQIRREKASSSRLGRTLQPNPKPTHYDSSGARHQGLNTEAQAVYAERGLNRIGIQTRGVERRGKRWHVIIANPKGRNARPTTVATAAAAAIDAAGWKAVARQVRTGKATPLEGLRFAHDMEGRPEMKALLARAIAAVRRAPNPSRSAAARKSRRRARAAVGGSRRIRRAVARYLHAPSGSRAQTSARVKYIMAMRSQAARTKKRHGLPNPKGRAACGKIGKAWHDCLHGRKVACGCRGNPKGRVSLDAATRKHLDAWLKNNRRGGYVTSRTKIYWALHQYPELIEQGRTWAEIERLGEDAERNPKGRFRKRRVGRGRVIVKARELKLRHRVTGPPVAARELPLRPHRNPIGLNIDRRSIRTIVRSGRRILVGCPKGKYSARTSRCRVGTRKVNRRKGGVRHVTTPGSRRPRARASHSTPRRRPNPATTESAAKLVRMFEDRGPIKVKTKRLKAPKPLKGAVAKIGDVVQLVYRSKKFDGKQTDYEHDFKAPRPVLVADPATGDLNIVRGKSAYDLTPDGIIN